MKVKTTDGYEGVLMTAEDYEGYERNRPSNEWELIDYGDVQLWTPSYMIEVVA